MAQATDFLRSLKDCYLEYSLNGSTWVPFGGYATSIDVDASERASGEVHTYDGDTPIVGIGKRGPITATARLVYSEADSLPFDVLWDAHIACSNFYLRGTPKGDNTGDVCFTSDLGFIISAQPPLNQEADSGDPVLCEFQHKCAFWLKGTLTT